MKSRLIVLFRYSSIINIEISTASHTIKVAFTSIAANVTVSDCTGGSPVNADTSPLTVKILEVKTLNKKIIKLAANNPIMCGFNDIIQKKFLQTRPFSGNII